MPDKTEEPHITISEEKINETMVKHNITREQAIGMLDQKKRFEYEREKKKLGWLDALKPG